jgi:catechol 2,3-dioxygenase-like lactoylglutathione lyase family enzyme
MPTPDPAPLLRVSELRISLTVKDHAALRAFYRDALGLTEAQSWEFHGHGVVLDAGRATLELIDEEHAEFVDEVEVGERVAGPVRLAFAVDDAGEASARLVAAGAELLAEARPTPWGDVNARVRPAEGPQVTVFSPPPEGE